MRSLKALFSILLAFSGALVSAEVGSVSVKGSFRLRPEYFSHPDFLTDRSDTLLRLRPEILWTPSSEIAVFLQPQAAKSFGEPAFVPGSTTTNRASDSSGTQNSDTSPVTFHQAYADYRPFERVTLRLGRQVLSYGEETIIGAADWANVARTFDAIRVLTVHELGSSDLFTAKIRDTNVGASGPGDKDFHGLYNTLDFGRWLNRLEVYVLDVRDASVSGVHPTTLIATGLRLKSALDWFDYRVEGTNERGVSMPSGAQYYGEFGGTWRGARASLEYFNASRDYQQLFPSAHRYLGMGDELGRRNVRGYALHFSATPWRPLDVRLDYFDFTRVDASGAMYRVDGTTALGSAAGSTSDEVGREVDVWLKFSASVATSWSLGYSKFLSGRYFGDQLGKRNPEFAYVQFETLF